jgi:ribosomal protein L3
MRFPYPREAGPEAPVQTVEPEETRVRIWQRERLGRMGYDRRTAERLVVVAWDEGDHADFVHRIEDLVARGATLDQAARIVTPAGLLGPGPEGAPDAEV